MSRARLVAQVLLSGTALFGCGSDQAPGTLPRADAGFDQVIHVGDEVVLDGSASLDPGGAALSYRWSFVSRPAASQAALVASTTAQPHFVADATGTYLTELVVASGARESAPDRVAVVAQAEVNLPPRASPSCTPCSAAHDTGASTAQLKGAGSYDPEGAALTYYWSQITSASECATSCPAMGSCTPRAKPVAWKTQDNRTGEFYVPDDVGTFVFALTVSDGELSGMSCVAFEVTNTPPVASAKACTSCCPCSGSTPPIDVNKGGTFYLDSTGSGDTDAADQSRMQYQWHFDSEVGFPADAQIVPVSSTTPTQATVTLSLTPSTSPITFWLDVFDGFATTKSSDIVVNINP